MTQTPNIKFQEEYSAKLPALALLVNLGWQFLPPEQALALRGGKQDAVVLKDVLRGVLKQREFVHAGKRYPLSDKSVDKIIAEVCSPALNEGLAKANEKLYNHMLYGISVQEFVEGKKVSPTVSLIDWHNVAANQFHFTEEFTVTRSGGVEQRRPDIVCFVNGLPWVVIEAKRPDGKKGPTVSEGISQSLRNQRPDEIPHLFAYNQLILSIASIEARYGTCHTPEKFFAAWREEDINEGQMLVLKNKALSAEQVRNLFNHRKPEDLTWYKNLVAGGELAVTEQDKLIIALLTPERLLEMVRFYTLFDAKAGKIVARYQQVFGIKRLIERVNQRTISGAREGGVIWHTTGSGKSFTMVFLSKAMILHDALKQCRVLVITDRVDLEAQLSNTFMSGGELTGKRGKSEALASTGKMLAEQIGQGNQRIMFSLIQKFNSATKLDICKNTSPDFIVLIDEGHRSQGGENNIRMRQALPNAAFVAFTGTPLLKDEKTERKFGPIVHAYTMQRAVEDKTVTPLLYEERKPELSVNEEVIDAWFERITDGISDEARTELKRKLARKGHIFSTDDRIRMIALDIANHYVKNIDDGLKGQLACDSKESAIKYKKYLDEAGLFESAVVMSAPDTREGNKEVDESSVPAVVQWWKDNVGSTEEKVYTKQVVERFDTDDKLKMIIVVDKLLTGFDEPKNTVLYIDKNLKQHNLIQAIARVNRLHPMKKFGYLIDYRGILKELDTTIADYKELADRTQGGYDEADIAGLYSEMSSEYKQLPSLYKQLWSVFDGAKNKNDGNQLLAVVLPKMVEMHGQFVDVNQATRDNFISYLKQFASCLKVALQSAKFFEDTAYTDIDRRNYKETVKQLTSLRQVLLQKMGTSVDIGDYEAEVKKLLDRHVVGVQVHESEGAYNVGGMGEQTTPDEWNDDKTRNETDIIKTRVTKMIEQELRDDPYAQEAFSKLLRDVIAQAEELFNHPMKQYMLFQEFEQQVSERQLEDIPQAFADNKQAQAFWGVLKKELPAAFEVQDEQVQQQWIDLAFTIDQAVDTAVAENSINPQNIEAAIKKSLLPKIFAACKGSGFGMNDVNRIIEQVVQITRLGVANA